MIKKNIYFYEVGYHSPEDTYYITLSHTKKFTKSDFDNMLIEYINSRKNLPKKCFSFKNTLGYIIPDCFVPYLCRRKGFKKFEYELTYSKFGWPDIFDEKDWDHQRSDLNIITNKLIKRKKYEE